jgi:hypothetical protein
LYAFVNDCARIFWDDSEATEHQEDRDGPDRETEEKNQGGAVAQEAPCA